MFGSRLWQTKVPVLAVESVLDEGKKDVFPIGTIKKYAKDQLWIKVGDPKKPWKYYATIGTEKANAALQAGAVVVVDFKGVAPATPEMLAKYGQKHPFEGGSPPPIEGLTVGGPAPKAVGTPAGGVVSVPTVGAEPEPAPDSKKALTKKYGEAKNLNGILSAYQDMINDGHDPEVALEFLADYYGDILGGLNTGLNKTTTIALALDMEKEGVQKTFDSYDSGPFKKAVQTLAPVLGYPAPQEDKLAKYASPASFGGVLKVYKAMVGDGINGEEAIDLLASKYPSLLSVSGDHSPGMVLAVAVDIESEGVQSTYDNNPSHVQDLVVKVAAVMGKAPPKPAFPKTPPNISEPMGAYAVYQQLGKEGHTAADALDYVLTNYEKILGNYGVTAKKALAIASNIASKTGEQIYDLYKDKEDELKAAVQIAKENNITLPVPKKEPLATDAKGVFDELHAMIAKAQDEAGVAFDDLGYELAGQDAIGVLANKYDALLKSTYGMSASVVLDVAFDMHRKGAQTIMDLYPPPHTPGSLSDKLTKMIPKLAKDLGMTVPTQKQEAPSLVGWDHLPNPKLAMDTLPHLMKAVQDVPGIYDGKISFAEFAKTDSGKVFAASYGDDLERMWRLARYVQVYSNGGTDADGLLKVAGKSKDLTAKMNKVHGANWKDKVNAISKVLAANGMLADMPAKPIAAVPTTPSWSAPESPPAPAKPKKLSPTIGAGGFTLADLGEYVAKGESLLDLLKKKPEIVDVLSKKYGIDAVDVAHLAASIMDNPKSAFSAYVGAKGSLAQAVFSIGADLGETPSLWDIAKKVNENPNKDLGSTVDEIATDHPEVTDHLNAFVPNGIHIKPEDVAFYAAALASEGSQVFDDYAHFDKDSPTRKIIDLVAKAMGLNYDWPKEASAPAHDDDDPSTSTSSTSPASLVSFKSKILNIGSSAYGFSALVKEIEAAHPGLLSGFKAGEGYPNEQTAPDDVLRVAKHILTYGVEDAIQNWPTTMSADSVKKLGAALGAELPKESPPAAAGGYTVSDSTKYKLGYAIKTPKKGQAYQALKKLGYDHESPEAKAVTALHKYQDKELVTNWLKARDMTAQDATNMLDTIIAKAAKTGAFTVNAEGIPTFPELKSSKKKKKPVGADIGSGLSSFAAEIKAFNHTGADWISGSQDIANKIKAVSPEAFADFKDDSGSAVAGQAVVIVASSLLKNGLEQAYSEYSHIMSKASMQKLQAALGVGGAAASDDESEDAPSAPPAAPSKSVMPSEIPPMSELKLKGDAKSLGGAGQKAIYVDSQGKEYLFKVAANKAGTKVEPARAEIQAAFSKIARMVKKEHPPIGVVTVDGKLGTIYPFLPATGNLKGVAPSTLSAKERFDVAVEHILDWLGSQHDSHSANHLRTPDGRIVAIDKEQGFKYFPNDKLDINYHPNSQYGENEPYYNTYWRDWSDKKFEFEPKYLDNVIKSVEAISGPEYMNTLRPYAENRFPGDLYAQEKFLRLALNRKLTLRRDYEKFLTGLHEKREGKKGKFTFDGGWLPEGEKAKPKIQTITMTAEEYAEKQSVRVRPFKKNNGDTDPTKLTLKVNLGSVAELEEFLKSLKLDALEPVKQGQHYSMVYVSAEQFNKAKITKDIVIQPEDQETIAPYSGTPKYITAPEMLERVTPNSADMKTISSNKTLGIGGKRITLDGPAVEGQVAKVKRRKDTKGEYYDVQFKLREPTWNKISGGSPSTYEFKTGTYDEATDTLSAPGGVSTSTSTKKWTSGDSEVHLAASSSSYSFMGSVYARVRPKAGQTVEDALGELLDKMKPGLSKEVLKDPTPEERELAKMARLLSAVAPQVHDKIPVAERTAATLKTKLAKQGWKADRIAQVAEVETIPGHSSHIAPGLWKEAKGADGNPALRFLYWGVSTPARIGMMLKGGGIMGIHERIMAGKEDFGASASSDIESGGADNVTLRCAVASGDSQSFGANNNVGGTYQIIIAPDECDRLDMHLALGDSYGSMKNAYWTGRKSLATQIQKFNDSPYTSNVEMVIRRGISSKKFLRICTDGETNRQTLIKELKSQGIEEVNGVPVEDFVVVESTKGGAYKKYVKPAGF